MNDHVAGDVPVSSRFVLLVKGEVHQGTNLPRSIQSSIDNSLPQLDESLIYFSQNLDGKVNGEGIVSSNSII